MKTLFFLEISLVILCFTFLVIPLMKNNRYFLCKDKYLVFYILSAFIVIIFCFYPSKKELIAYANWQKSGETHYNLMVQYEALGGLEGLITKVKAKIKANPNDKTGYFILNKLLMLKNAEKKANQLLPTPIKDQ